MINRDQIFQSTDSPNQNIKLELVEGCDICLGSVVISDVPAVRAAVFHVFHILMQTEFSFPPPLTWLAGCTPPTRCSRTLPLSGAPKVSGHRVQI